MKKVVLISCVSKKLPHRARAEDLYVSPLFRLNLEYARKLRSDAIYILSAKYGLLDLDTLVEPYDVTLNAMNASQAKEWAQGVVRQLGSEADLTSDHFVLLAGEKYRKHLTPHLASYEVPLEGLTIGRQLQKLRRWLDE